MIYIFQRIGAIYQFFCRIENNRTVHYGLDFDSRVVLYVKDENGLFGENMTQRLKRTRHL